MLRNFAKWSGLWAVSLLFLLVAFPFAFVAGIFSRGPFGKPRLVWGSDPIINNAYWSRAMVIGGYSSETFTTDFYSAINTRKDWGQILSEKYRLVPASVKPFYAFLAAILKYDVFFISFNGFFIGNTPARYFQAPLLKLAKKKIVVVPYGSDAFVYRRVRSVSVLHGLLSSYPLAAINQKKISSNVDYWVAQADVVISGIMGPEGFGRWDVFLPSPLFLDLEKWTQTKERSLANGRNGKVVIVHAPNHRGFKGTEFLIDAVDKLKNEGLEIELRLLEKLQNSEVRRVLSKEADILVEQIIAPACGLNGLEGMAAGVPTISNVEEDLYFKPLRRWSYFTECPLVSAEPENLIDVLRRLVTRPELRHELGRAGRRYVEKYHGLDSARYLFSNVIDYVYGRRNSLINLYHPLLGEYPNRSPKIQHPLLNNRIVD